MKSLYNNSASYPQSDATSGLGAGDVDAQHHTPSTSIAAAPRTVIRGESFKDSSNSHPLPNCGDVTPDVNAHPFSAHTDWLNCTIPIGSDSEFLTNFIHQFFLIAGDQFAPMSECGRGLHGWKQSFDLGETRAKLAIGGQNNTIFLSLPGEACTLIPLGTWPALSTFLNTHYNGRITRWDGAVDDYKGEHSVDWAVAQYQRNQFNAGGNKPTCNQSGNWIDPDGSGRTFYVGKRKNGKLIRIYEKGKQLGDPNSPWVRWELEIHNKQREIPWDVLINPGPYVAGAYPCTQWVSSETSRIKTIKETAKIGYGALTHFARQAYGPLLNVMMEQEGSPEKIIELLIREGKPARLQLPIPPELKGSLLSEDDQ